MCEMIPKEGVEGEFGRVTDYGTGRLAKVTCSQQAHLRLC